MTTSVWQARADGLEEYEKEEGGPGPFQLQPYAQVSQYTVVVRYPYFGFGENSLPTRCGSFLNRN